MSLCQDRQIKGFLLFLTLFALLFVGTATVLTIYQVNGAEALWLKHDEAVSSSLLEQSVPKEVIAVAFTNTDISEDGRSLLAAAGLGKQSESSMRPYFNQFQRSAFCTMLCTVLFFLFVLAVGIFVFFWKRKRLYQQADKILLNYINGDYSCHISQNYEGAIYQVFSSVEQLATMLQSKNETERKAKEFLKDTISDISHQLKTPLAALTMYVQLVKGTTDEDVYVIRQMVDSSFTFADERMGNSSTMGTYYCFWLFIYGFLVLIAMITIFNIINSISMSVSARLKQYGAFRAIGVSMGQLSKMIVAEAFTYTIIGGVVGTVLGLFCNKLLFGMLISYRWGDAWTPPLPEVAVILLIVVSSVILAVHGPIKRIRNMSIVDTISAQ